MSHVFFYSFDLVVILSNSIGYEVAPASFVERLFYIFSHTYQKEERKHIAQDFILMT